MLKKMNYPYLNIKNFTATIRAFVDLSSKCGIILLKTELYQRFWMKLKDLKDQKMYCKPLAAGSFS